MARTHELKIWPQWFDAVRLGTKTFEIRKNDRDYMVGDMLVLNEFRHGVGQYTGRKLERRITYIAHNNEPEGDFGLKAGYVVLGIAPP